MSLEALEAMDMQADMERLMFFDHARLAAEATYVKNPLDADVCFSILFAVFMNHDAFLCLAYFCFLYVLGLKRIG